MSVLAYKTYYDLLNDEVIPDTDADPLNKFLIPLGVAHPEGENTSFKNGIQFAWDSTSIALYKTCPRKYYLTMHEGWTEKVTPPPLAFGIYVHRIFQAWHQLLAHGFEKPAALSICVRAAGLLGERLPRGDTARGKEQLIRTTIWYIDQFWDDPAKTIILSDGSPAVEYSFTFPLFTYKTQTAEAIDVYLSGHIDRFCTWQNRVLAQDYKTTKYGLDRRYLAKFKPHTQFPIYVAAAHIIAAETQELASTDGLLLDAIQLGVNFNRYQRHIIPFSLEEIDEYVSGLKYWITRAMRDAEEEHFPANEESCDKYGGCPFREICAKPPARRQDYLRGSFVKKVWDPLRSR